MPLVFEAPLFRFAPAPGAQVQLETAEVLRSPLGPGGMHLQLDLAAVRSGPIHRAHGKAWLERDGQRLEAPAAIRAHLPRALGPTGHLASFRARQPGLLPVAVTGCGNLGMNAGVLARQNGFPERLGVLGPTGAWITVREDGSAEAHEPEAGTPMRFALSGPSLVRAGRIATPAAETIADLRHALSFPYVDFGLGRIDFGQATLSCHAESLRAAWSGTPIAIDLRTEWELVGRAIPKDQAIEVLTQALAAKAYRAVPAPKAPGDYHLDGTTLHIAFRPGLYPHQALGVDAAGQPFVALVRGRSNRAGTTLGWLAADLCEFGAVDAILLDNGGDVGLWREDLQRFTIQPAEADRAFDWPLTAALIHTEADQRSE